MEISVGQPPADGCYVVFTPCEAQSCREYCEPEIATWHGGRWHTWRPVYGWIGPLPVIQRQQLIDRQLLAGKSWDEVFSDKVKVEGGWMDRPKQEYDL